MSPTPVSAHPVDLSVEYLPDGYAVLPTTANITRTSAYLQRSSRDAAICSRACCVRIVAAGSTQQQDNQVAVLGIEVSTHSSHSWRRRARGHRLRDDAQPFDPVAATCQLCNLFTPVDVLKDPPLHSCFTSGLYNNVRIGTDGSGSFDGYVLSDPAPATMTSPEPAVGSGTGKKAGEADASTAPKHNIHHLTTLAQL